MKKETRTSSPKPAQSPVLAKLQKVLGEGRASCALTWTEFEDVRSGPDVEQEGREIFQDLGLLGYYRGAVAIFDAGNWSDSPLTFRDAQDLP